MMVSAGRVATSNIGQDEDLLDSGDHDMLRFQKSGSAAHLTRKWRADVLMTNQKSAKLPQPGIGSLHDQVPFVTVLFALIFVPP